jgi:hypothetical protein
MTPAFRLCDDYVRRWHARALALGPIGLGGMAGMLRFDLEES